MSKPRRSYRAVLFLLSTLGLLAACGDDDHPAGGPEAESPVVQARIAKAERLEAPGSVELFGAVEADRTAAVSTRVMAMVTSVPVQMGDRVRKGQLLLEIDPQASQGQLAQVQGALGQARAALSLAQRNFERFQALADKDAASELELDMAQMQYEQALGAVEQAEGAVASASAIAADSRVVAPFEGRVLRRMVEVGDLAAPGRPLMMLESSGSRRLAIFVPESLAIRTGLAVGSEVEVAIDSRPDLGRLAAQVVEMTPGADPASHSYQVNLALPLSELPTGAAGRAWLPTETESVVSVPADSLMKQGGMTLVIVRTDRGEASPRVITVGRQLAADRVEILSGLDGGESLLVGLEVVPPVGARVEEVAS